MNNLNMKPILALMAAPALAYGTSGSVRMALLGFGGVAIAVISASIQTKSLIPFLVVGTLGLSIAGAAILAGVFQ